MNTVTKSFTRGAAATAGGIAVALIAAAAMNAIVHRAEEAAYREYVRARLLLG